MKPTSLHFLLGLAAPGILMSTLLAPAPYAAGSGPASTDNGEVPGLRIRVRFEAESPTGHAGTHVQVDVLAEREVPLVVAAEGDE